MSFPSPPNTIGQTHTALSGVKYIYTAAGGWRIEAATLTASGIANVPSGNLSATDVQAALDELQSELDALNITGQYVGSAATFAALPTTDAAGDAVNNSDWAVLTADDGGNIKGIYFYDGAAWTFVIELSSSVGPATSVSPEADDQTGAVGATGRYADEEHKHAAQAASVTVSANTPTNYTAATSDVDAHLAGIDDEIARITLHTTDTSANGPSVKNPNPKPGDTFYDETNAIHYDRINDGSNDIWIEL